MNLIVLSPDKKVFEGKVSRITVPGTEGEFEILDQHAALVSSLMEGTVVVNALDSKESFTLAIQNGFIEVLENQVSLMVQEA
jgi:F-type H+-transporting ATPase subunit epsilon